MRKNSRLECQRLDTQLAVSLILKRFELGIVVLKNGQCEICWRKRDKRNSPVPEAVIHRSFGLPTLLTLESGPVSMLTTNSVF